MILSRRKALQVGAGLGAAALFDSRSLFGLGQQQLPLLTKAIPSNGEQVPVIGLGSAGTFNLDASSLEARELLEVVRRFEGSKVRIVSLSIHDSTECAFVRFLLSHPEQGREILERSGLPLIETDLIGIELPNGTQPLLQVCTALLQAEVNIVQAYPLLMRPHGRPAVALMVDNIEMGMETLATKGFAMITEGDLIDAE